MAVAVERADQVRGIVFGDTWFWPTDELAMKIFSWDVQSPLQYDNLRRNLFVERLVPAGTRAPAKRCDGATTGPMQPGPDARKGVAECPSRSRRRPLLARLAREVPDKLGAKPSLFVWGMKDFGIQIGPIDPADARHFCRSRSSSNSPNAEHFIQEMRRAEIATAICRARFSLTIIGSR